MNDLYAMATIGSPSTWCAAGLDHASTGIIRVYALLAGEAADAGIRAARRKREPRRR